MSTVSDALSTNPYSGTITTMDDTAGAPIAPKTPYEIANENWQRYEYAVWRGHREYTETAKMLEGMYLGGLHDLNGNLLPGGHWSELDMAHLHKQRRPAYEFNQIKPGVDAALGYQISNRMEISFLPRSGDANQELAEVRSKVAMQIADDNRLYWAETDVFSDGMIQQRGFFDVRMDWDEDLIGHLKITTEDPLDVIPDPDGKQYDPSTWSDVIVTRFLSLDDIQQRYGDLAKTIASQTSNTGYQEREFGDDADGARRNTFGTEYRYDSQYTSAKVTRFRIIDRQYYIRTMMPVAIYPFGDIRQLNGDEPQQTLDEMHSQGCILTTRMVKRVRWTVTTYDTVLHDDWSPYDRFTIVPFFPYFRRGHTRGMVDAAVDPQKALDKALSQAVHIVNSTANSGWQLEKGQLTNMTTEDLQDWGAMSGLVLERQKNTAPLEKIEPNEMPGGIEKLIELSANTVQEVTVPDAMRGIIDGSESGIAIQSRQHAAQQILALPLDNLSRTRHMLAAWIDYAISKYYNTERTMRITKTDPDTGKENYESLTVNKYDPNTGMHLNDMTVGEYDIVVAEQPMQVTFENGQFQQLMDMREKGLQIPDAAIIRRSNVADKADIIASMQQQSQQQQPPPDPLTQAKVAESQANAAMKQAQTDLVKAQTVQQGMTSIYSATEAAQLVAVNPQLAPVSDQMLQSVGFEDKAPPPVVATPEQAAGLPAGVIGSGAPVQAQPPPIPQGLPQQQVQADGMRQNTHPLTPAGPGLGLKEGFEGGGQTQPANNSQGA